MAMNGWLINLGPIAISKTKFIGLSKPLPTNRNSNITDPQKPGRADNGNRISAASMIRLQRAVNPLDSSQFSVWCWFLPRDQHWCLGQPLLKLWHHRQIDHRLTYREARLLCLLLPCLPVARRQRHRMRRSQRIILNRSPSHPFLSHANYPFKHFASKSLTHAYSSFIAIFNYQVSRSYDI